MILIKQFFKLIKYLNLNIININKEYYNYLLINNISNCYNIVIITVKIYEFLIPKINIYIQEIKNLKIKFIIYPYIINL